MRKLRSPRKTNQLVLQTLGWGGVRQGAGRPKKKGAKVGHKKRPEIKKLTPLHVTLRLKEDLPSLRTKRGFKIFRQAVLGARKKGLKVLQFALLGNHFHILIEAKSNDELARAMRSLNGRLALRINQWVCERRRRSGPIFTERFHLEVLKTPTQVKRAMLYIFANAAKHFHRSQICDAFCSYLVFSASIKPDKKSVLIYKDWSQPRLSETQRLGWIELLSPAESWLGRVGWQKAT